MFIIWGTKRVERNQGVVADFCPICREIRSFQLKRVGMASHVYYLSFGEGKLEGFEIRCETCGVRLGVEPTRYVATSKGSPVNLEALARDTFPRLREVYANRLELEAKLRRSRSALSAEERQDFLIEPFALLNPLVEARQANSTEMDKPSSLGCLGTLLVAGGVFSGSMALKGRAQDRMLLAALILFAVGTVYTFVQMHLGPKRFVRAKILPSLVQSLRPLEPTREELTACIERCKTLGMRIGKTAKPDEVWSLLDRRMAGFDDQRV